MKDEPKSGKVSGIKHIGISVELNDRQVAPKKCVLPSLENKVPNMDSL